MRTGRIRNPVYILDLKADLYFGEAQVKIRDNRSEICGVGFPALLGPSSLSGGNPIPDGGGDALKQ
jgi:hypothetical protein